jgi:hypothetical protein
MIAGGSPKASPEMPMRSLVFAGALLLGVWAILVLLYKLAGLMVEHLF